MKKIRVNRQASRQLLLLADGLFGYAVDMTLWLTIYFAELNLPQSRSGQTWRAQIAADQFLNEINYDVIKQALLTAKKRGWIKSRKRNAPPKITAAGKRRLIEIIPQYDEARVWDNRIHLITYDIPETHHRDRDLLREYLRRLGCAKLQESVWLTPYNPIDVLREFIDEHDLQGTIIVSDLGADGAIGEENLTDLLVRIYQLDKLNERYLEWLDEIKDPPDHWAAIKYLSILRDDPQLPFPLLPSWWKGDEAYRKIMSLIKLSKQLPK